MIKNTSIIIDKSLNDDMKLYRYLTLGSFLELIELKRMYLTNLNNWEDPWELPAKHRESYGLKGTLLGQCWTSQGVSDAIWKMYGKNKEGILIETSVNKFRLLNNLSNSFLCPIIYYDNLDKTLNDIELLHSDMKVFYHGVLKRVAFKHEKEIRLISYINKDMNYDKKNLIISVEPHNFIENIFIDPRASDWYVDTITSYCNRCNINIIPQKSDLF